MHAYSKLSVLLLRQTEQFVIPELEPDFCRDRQPPLQSNQRIPVRSIEAELLRYHREQGSGLHGLQLGRLSKGRQGIWTCLLKSDHGSCFVAACIQINCLAYTQ